MVTHDEPSSLIMTGANRSTVIGSNVRLKIYSLRIEFLIGLFQVTTPHIVDKGAAFPPPEMGAGFDVPFVWDKHTKYTSCLVSVHCINRESAQLKHIYIVCSLVSTVDAFS